jgi:hypothetical protein
MNQESHSLVFTKSAAISLEGRKQAATLLMVGFGSNYSSIPPLSIKLTCILNFRMYVIPDIRKGQERSKLPRLL